MFHWLRLHAHTFGSIVFGVCLFMVAFGLLIRFRGGESSHAAVVGAQVVLGVAGG